MNILILGADGMLGRAWRELSSARAIGCMGVDVRDCDVTDPAQVERTIDAAAPTVVVNCAAYTDVDGAESDEARAALVNGTAVGNVVRSCDARGLPLVHYSTDYVFDGSAHAPYLEDHPVAPLNAYGRSKLRGEQAILASSGPHLLVRTSWLYAPWSKNFVRTILSLARSRPSLRVVDDQRGRPTSAEHLARVSFRLLEQRARGVFHVTDGGDATWFEFARAIAEIGGTACRVEPCTTAEFPRPARRPSYSVLDTARAERAVGAFPHWRVNLSDVLARVENV